jgi:hypothetical protein
MVQTENRPGSVSMEQSLSCKASGVSVGQAILRAV